MTVGPGKYDDLCTYVREQANAEAVILIVLGGNKGSGFSCQAIVPPDFVIEVVENTLKQMKQDVGSKS